jgi:hypothetical protein
MRYRCAIAGACCSPAHRSDDLCSFAGVDLQRVDRAARGIARQLLPRLARPRAIVHSGQRSLLHTPRAIAAQCSGERPSVHYSQDERLLSGTASVRLGSSSTEWCASWPIVGFSSVERPVWRSRYDGSGSPTVRRPKVSGRPSAVTGDRSRSFQIAVAWVSVRAPRRGALLTTTSPNPLLRAVDGKIRRARATLGAIRRHPTSLLCGSCVTPLPSFWTIRPCRDS